MPPIKWIIESKHSVLEMKIKAFREIDFRCRQTDPLADAAHIGTLCGNAWYHSQGELDFLDGCGYPEEIDDWTSRAKESWWLAGFNAWKACLKEAGDIPAGRIETVESCRLLGYHRHSRYLPDSNQARMQLVGAGVDPSRVFEDNPSTEGLRLPARDSVLDAARKGDVLVVWRLDCLADTTKDLLKICDRLGKKGVGLLSLLDRINTTTATRDGNFYRIVAALAEFEHNLNRRRTRTAQAAARHRGRKPGRKRKLNEKHLQQARGLLKDGNMTVAAVARNLKISPATLYRALPGGRSSIG